MIKVKTYSIRNILFAVPAYNLLRHSKQSILTWTETRVQIQLEALLFNTPVIFPIRHSKQIFNLTNTKANMIKGILIPTRIEYHRRKTTLDNSHNEARNKTTFVASSLFGEYCLSIQVYLNPIGQSLVENYRRHNFYKVGGL